MKTFFLALMITSVSLLAVSQEQYFGINSGVNFAHFSEKTLKSLMKFDYRIGINGGVKYEHYFYNNTMLGIDMMYSQQGFLSVSHGKNIDVSSKFYYDYLSLPIKFGYAFGNNIKIVPKIGIQTSYLLTANIIETINYIDDKPNDITKTNITATTPKIDFAGLVELELCYDINDNTSIYSSLFAKRSFNKFSGTDFMPFSEIKHLVFGVLFGIKFDISKDSN